MGNIVLAEKKIVFLNVTKPTAVVQANVNTLLACTFKKDVAEQKVTKISDVTGITESDTIYKIIQAAFLAGLSEVVIKGKSDVESYKDFFDDIKNDFFGVVTDTDDLTEISNKDKVQDLLDRALEYRKSNVTMPSIQSRLAPEEQETHRKTLEKVIEEMING